ncbi:hypothetical protein TELCIR_02835, partial [Teladorsagia circumcincta]
VKSDDCDNGDVTDWRSLTIASLDPNATESFFGWITAVYSLGQAVMCVGFGYWQNRIKQSRIPILAGLVLMFAGNLVYLLCGVTPFAPKWIMFVSRSVTGLGAGMVTVLRTYAVNASTVSDRSRSISLNSGSFALGLTIGPDEHMRFFALPKYDRWAMMICILTRFAQMFVITNLETLGAPISMTIFGWNKQQTVRYNSLMHGGFGFISFLIYAASVYYDIGKINLFAEYGPRPAWGMEIAFAGACALLWIIFYKRMVPLKLPKSFSAGEMFRNKHGMVYRF